MSDANKDKFQRQVDAFFMEAAKNGWDEARIRRKLEDVLRKSKKSDPTLFRRALYTMSTVLGIKLEDTTKDPKGPKDKGH